MYKDFLLSEQSVAFTTRDFALIDGISLSAASHKLATLERAHSIIRVSRGIWANTKHPYFSALSCISKLLGPEQGYLSFLSVLHRSGVLSQIPASIQIATTGRGRRLKTPVGTFEFFQLKPQLMQEEILWSNTHIPFRVASTEKALFDTMYLATRKGKRFAVLPEIDLESGLLNKRRFFSLLKRADIPERLRNSINKRVLRGQ